MNYRLLLGSVILLSCIDVAVRYIAPFFISEYKLYVYHALFLPHFLASFANYDGMHYMAIAAKGYYRNKYAFFPLYPSLINFLSRIIRSYFFAGLLISFSAFTGGVVLLKNYAAKIIANKQNRIYLLLIFIFYPTSFFLTSVYTEGLFFLFLIGYFHSTLQEKNNQAAIYAFLAALTRFIGLFLFIPSLISLFFNLKSWKNYILSVIAPLIGFAIFSGFLWLTTDDPLKFFHVQTTFGGQRTTHLVFIHQVYLSYINKLLQTKISVAFGIILLEILSTTACLTVLTLDLINLLRSYDYPYRRQRLTLNLFSWINILVPSFTGTFLSMPRFSIMSISVLIYLAELKSSIFKNLLIGSSLVLHILLLACFSQGYFIS